MVLPCGEMLACNFDIFNMVYGRYARCEKAHATPSDGLNVIKR